MDEPSPPPAPSPGHTATPVHGVGLSDEGCYLALKTRDARFDGRFFTGVTSTGIYCRPVCGVRTPRAENCRFFALAAQAEQAGFRPCLRCRPELAPQTLPWSLQDATHTLVLQAVQLLQSPQALATPTAAGKGTAPVAWLAQRLGVSERHLHRIFVATLGVPPLQYLQTRRLLTAKQLLTDTALPLPAVAQASGFGSTRRLQAAWTAHYGMAPSRLRPATRSASTARATTSNAMTAIRTAVVARLPWRPPLDAAALMGYFAQRQIPSVEQIDPAHPLTLRRTVQCPPVIPSLDNADWQNNPGNAPHDESGGWIEVTLEPQAHHAALRVSDNLLPALPQVLARVRALLDLDADPAAIHAVLQPHFAQGEGLRVPGCWDGFELAVRAVLGQQVSVAAARTLCTRLVQALGAPVQTPWPTLNRLFPSPMALAQASPDQLGALGITRQRQAALQALAQAVWQGPLVLQPQADPHTTMAQLRALPGIGDWTAQYIAMRALRWPDAFVAGDVALHHALGLRHQPQPARAALQRAAAWHPWRSYAVIRAWAQHAAQNTAQNVAQLAAPKSSKPNRYKNHSTP